MVSYYNLAMIRGDTNMVAPWLPLIGSGSGGATVYSLAIDTNNEQLLVAGDYADIGGNPTPADTYQHLAAYSIAPPVTISTSTEPVAGEDCTADGNFSSSTPLTVWLCCTDQSGKNEACTSTTYLTTDGTEPTTASTTYSASLLFTATTTLKYFSDDGDGNHESVHSQTYTIEVDPPQTTASLTPGTLNASTYTDLELLCDDGAAGSGCDTTYYSLDGSTPTNSYSIPIPLPDGDTTVKYYSVDQAGNAETVGTLQYTVDRDLPTISVSHDWGNYQPPLDVTLICDDGSGTGCDQIYLTTDGSDPVDPDDPVTPFTYTGPVTLTLNSASILRIVVSDVAGNSGSSTVGIYTFTDPSPVKRNGSGAIDGVILVLLALLALWRLRTRISGENAACR